MRVSLAAALAAATTACGASNAPEPEPRPGPPRIECGPRGRVEVSGAFTPGSSGFVVCIDERGLYGGPTAGVEVRGVETVSFRGAYRREAPAGLWVCTMEPGGARLEVEYDPERFAKVLWGIALDSIVGGSGDGHLAPPPANLCPREDWARLARNGFAVESLPSIGSLTAVGVVKRVRYVPPVVR